MVNRRTLRIKALQALYALRQVERSNHQLALDRIAEAFKPDLDSMTPEAPQKLEGMRRLAVLQFEDLIHQRTSDEEIPVSSRRVANEALHWYRDENRDARRRVLRRSVEEVEEIYDHYLRVLLLIIELGDEARLVDERKQFNVGDEVPTTPFSRNAFVQALAASTDLQREVLRRRVEWSGDDRLLLIRPFFRELRSDETFLAYCRQGRHTEEEDAALLMHIVKKVIFKNERLKAYFEESDLRWSEDKDIVRSLVVRTIKTFEEGTLTIQALSPNWEDDKVFFQDLLKLALDHEAEYEGLVTAQIQNWDAERVALTDRLLLTLAVAELLHFPSIPVKVTINEFIEVAKEYSTPKSGQFLNGVLDTLAIKLREQGTLRKSGRGLIDNR
jgi:N utilization substance protein B